MLKRGIIPYRLLVPVIFHIFSSLVVEVPADMKIRMIPKHIEAPEYYTTGKSVQMKTLTIKKDWELDVMRESCKLARKTLDYAGRLVKPGVKTLEIDEKVFDFIIKHNAYPSPLNYMGFPKSVCTSVNEVICHGIPNDRALRDGDVINIDVTVFFKGFHGDCSKTFPVGIVKPEVQSFLNVSEKILMEAIKVCGPGVPFHMIGRRIQEIAAKSNVTSCQGFSGHGIGREFHELPQILHFENDGNIEMVGVEKMLPGMTFTIEPIIKIGTEEFILWKDGWTIQSKDRFIHAQTEHTIAILQDGVEILTAGANETRILQFSALGKK
jgi:methionyl aminopeptidase